jgi:sugar phosphate isomerase/epimerase
MAKLCVSNIGLSPLDHEDELYHLPDMGIEALEVAPSRVWQDTWQGLSSSRVEHYRRVIEAAGLKVAGLHSLFWDQPDLGLFLGRENREKTLDFLTHLSRVCADLGGKTLIYGSAPARRRGELPIADADTECIDFFGELAERISGHGTCFAFEPLDQETTDYIHTLKHAVRIVDAVANQALRTHFDAKALVAAEEANEESFRLASASAVNFHANEPDLGVLGTSHKIDHAELGRLLKGIDYQGYVSIEQRMLNADAPLKDVGESARILRQCYL